MTAEETSLQTSTPISKLPPGVGGGTKVLQIFCPVCEETESSGANARRNRTIQVNVAQSGGGIELTGILTCLADGHQMAVRMRNDHVIGASENLPASESNSLPQGVPDGLRQDLKEAERAYLFSGYKACGVMCRRVLQLTLREMGVKDGTLSTMLAKAKKKFPTVMTDEIFSVAMAVKGIGDQGAHRKEDVAPIQALLAIYAASSLLKAFSPRLSSHDSASQSGTSSNAP